MSVKKVFSALILWMIYMPVVCTTYIVVWLDRHVRFRFSFPRNVAELSERKTWFENILKKQGLIPESATVKSFKVTTLNPDLIFRSDAGVAEVDYSVNDTDSILKVFVKFAPGIGTVWNRTIFNLQLNHIKETDFNHYFLIQNKSIPAPEAYYAEKSFITGNLCLMTEYMTDSVEYKDSVFEELPQAYVEQAITGLAKLHTLFWESKNPLLSKILPIEDSTVLLFESMMWNKWSHHARYLLTHSWKHVNKKQTVLHGDARVGNMMFAKDSSRGRFVLFDWQAVRQGMAAYDLAYFLVLSLSAEQRKNVEQSALQLYHRCLSQSGISDYSFEQFKDDYNHSCICTLVLLSLPFLSGEASARGDSALIFAWGMGVWRDRLSEKFKDFDYDWIKKHYGLNQSEAKAAIDEMINTINERLLKINHTAIA